MKPDKTVMDKMIRFRATAQAARRVDDLMEETGLTVSEVMRLLLANAELRPITTLTLNTHISTENSHAAAEANNAPVAN